MEVLVVFLPLAAFLIAGSVALFGYHVPSGIGHGHDHGHGGHHHSHGHGGDAHHDHAHEDHHEHDGHHDHHHLEADWRDRLAQFVTCGALIVCAALSWKLFFSVTGHGGVPRVVELGTWISSGLLDVKWALRIDQLTAVMLVVVNTVSACVHVYSVGYMADDPQKPRFMA